MERIMKNGSKMKKANLLILADTLEVYGGAERHVLDLATHLGKDKYNLFVSSLIPGGNVLKEIAANGAQVELFPVKRIYSIFGILKGFEFMRFLRKNKIDILMTIHFGSDVWGTIFGRLAGVPVIISNRRDIGFWKKMRHIWAYRFINRWVDRIIVNCSASKNKVIEDENVIPGKIKVIHGAVDVRKFKPSRRKRDIRKDLGISSNKIVIGAVGNFNPIKGHKYLIEAAASIVKKSPKAHFLLVGDGLEKQRLAYSVERLGLQNNVTFLGSRNDIPDILSIMDICVLPSLSEGLSNALIEYMVAGKPIIATQVGGNPELIEGGVSGMLIEAGKADAIEKAIIELINDKEKAKYLAKNARKKTEKDLGMRTMIGNYEEILSGYGKKRVLHLVSSNGLFGAEKVLLDIARFNNQNGTDVIVGAIKNSHNPHTEVVSEAERLGLETAIFESNGRMDPETMLQIKKYIRENRIDIVHTHNYKSDMLGFLATRFTDAKWIATNHVWHGTDKKLRFYEKLDSFILRFVDKVIAVSDEIKDDLVKKGIREDKIERIYNGIDTSAVSGLRLAVCGKNSNGNGQQLRKKLGIAKNDIVVTTVGRLSPEKGYAVFLKAAEKIIKKRNSTKFLIVGDGPLFKSHKSQVTSHKLQDYVKFLGIRNDIAEILSVTDIYVNASYIEGMPITILEAMRAGLPVVATRAGATPQVISHGRSGVLVDSGDPQRLADEIESLISDRSKRLKLGKHAYEDVRSKFSLERMGCDYAEVYQEVLA
jgi:glycosyltransferase involved in cell wall biosynthesis